MHNSEKHGTFDSLANYLRIIRISKTGQKILNWLFTLQKIINLV